MIHIIYHGYFSFAIHRVVQDLINKGTGVLAKPHTDYILEADKNGIVARDLKGSRPRRLFVFRQRHSPGEGA